MIKWITARISNLFRYALKFGVVGVIALLVDLVIFNILCSGIFGKHGFLSEPLPAKTVAVAVSTLFAWFGNRFWTFRAHRRSDYWLELIEFILVAIGGLGVSLLCLWISHYVLGFTSLLADNIATNVVGLFLATAFRFLLYRYWVYGLHRKHGLNSEEHQARAASISLFEPESQANLDSQN